MLSQKPDFEVRIKGHPLVRIMGGEASVNGRDFHTDIKNLSSLVDMLQEILDTAQEAKKPKLVSGSDTRAA